MEERYYNEFVTRRKKFLAQSYESSLKQILSYLWEYKWRFSFIVVLGIVQSFLFLTLPLFLGPALDILVNPEADLTEVYPLFLLLFVLQGVVAVLFGIRVYTNRAMGANIIYKLRNDLFLTIQKMSFSWLDNHKTGDLLSRTTSDINLLKEFLGNNLQAFIRQLATVLLSFAVLFIINVELAFYILIISPALFYVLIRFRKKMRPVFKKSRETYSDLTHDIQENVQGIKVVKSFARENHEIKDFKEINDEYFKDSMNIIQLQATFDPLINLIDNIAFLIVLLLGGLFVFRDKMTFGDLFAFFLILNFSVNPLYFISRFLGNMPQITETSERISHILNSKVDIEEKEDAKEITQIKGSIEFKNVSFAYDTKKEQENKKNEDSKNPYYDLKNINLKIEPGENIAILGSTGSGKSTLIKLIPRFYDPNKGEILIDGININKISLKSLRKQIGYVSQERILFSRTIENNIAFGKRNISLKEVKSVANIANIHSFIEEELPKKYETEVSERGSSLSGGQKQRLAIARALAIKPTILLLDDCFSSVDVDTEYEIQKHLKNFSKDCTTLLITQRLSTVRHADRILVLENGEITQLGTHDELMEQKEGIYYKLYTTLKIEERA
ncbi:MAG: putative multidrug export ATP-binding/permease protein [Promethearchaeota archaeon]|nr:MAG: putative multidrug export ATP-binding/permease protein [Candidatus Lokiarchaeota archaeon]